MNVAKISNDENSIFITAIMRKNNVYTYAKPFHMYRLISVAPPFTQTFAIGWFHHFTIDFAIRQQQIRIISLHLHHN